MGQMEFPKSRLKLQGRVHVLLHGEAAAPAPIVLLLLALAVPDLLAFDLGGLHFPIYRIYLLILLPWAIYRLFVEKIPLERPDWLIIAFAILQGVSLSLQYGPFTSFRYPLPGSGYGTTTAFINGLTTLVESLTPYLAARAFIRTREELTATVRFLVFLVLALAIPALIESVTGISAFGRHAAFESGMRYGLHRASGPFPHAILWGLFAASAFSFALGVPSKGGFGASRALLVVGVVVAAWTSVSSAALASLAIQAALLLWFVLSVSLRNRGLYFSLGAAAAYLFIELFSNRSAVQVIFSYTALDAWTGYYRTLIWQFGWADFLNSPLIGLGYRDWARPVWMTGWSVDAFWLVIHMRYGLLAAVPLVLAVASAMLCVGLGAKKQLVRRTHDLEYLWLATVASLVIAGFTVHYWAQSYVEFFFLLGMWSVLALKRQTPTSN